MVYREDVDEVGDEVGDLFGGVRVGECLTCGESQGCVQVAVLQLTTQSLSDHRHRHTPTLAPVSTN